MLAMADGDHKFLCLDAGTNGANSDAAVVNQYQLHEYIVTNQLDIPGSETIVPGDSAIPYFFQSDDPFALKTY